ncbi:hypothetical protein [Flavobacterium hydrophilum]|nr:hypothetical protein [Flavobacterium hydrophilum]
MLNNTLNEDDYKEAVRSKYEKEKDGIYSNYLGTPSQANLRDLCWKIFKSGNTSEDDLAVYNDFFKFEFDGKNENTSPSYTNSFKKLGKFFRRETKPAKIDTINFAAVLVDFEFRPFGKFKKYYNNDQKNSEEENLMDEPKAVVEPELERSVINDVDRSQPNNLNDEIGFIKNPESLNFVGNVKSKFFEKLFKKSKSTIIITLVMFFLIGGVIYFAFIKKHCMQWSGDHYEEVSCDLEVQGIGTYISVEPLDERVIHLKKIKVSDTTTFFKNGEAIIWYAKVGDRVEFFTTHGRHPENNKPLKPVTQYIIDKYVKQKE